MASLAGVLGALQQAPLWLLPPSCRACGALLPPGMHAPGYPYLCAPCHGALPWSDPPAGAATPANTEALSEPLPLMPGPLHTLATAMRYGAPVPRWVQQLKYERRLGMLPLLGRLLAETPAATEALLASDWVVPVPLHRRRLMRRGFNQSHLLAHAWLRAARGGAGADATLPLLRTDVLVRHRYTAPQVTMSAAERRTNVADAFSLHPRLARQGSAGDALLAGRHVLLVDDVATTGATLQACAQVLLQGGAATVSAVAVARG